MNAPAPLSKRLAAEATGTAFLLMAVIGSGVMGERLADGNVALALLANSIATGCALAVLILIFAPVSGAHFNPVVTACLAADRKISGKDALAYMIIQVAAAVAGAISAHLMFGEPLLQESQNIRTGGGQWWSEFIAAFGLLMVILGCFRKSAATVALSVGAYITAAYWFTASTSFANPAVTIARAFSDTFSGVRPEDAWPFILAQCAGAATAAVFSRWIFRQS